MAGRREELGRLVRAAWVKWAQAQVHPHASWLTPWEELDGAQQEADMRIGEAVAANEREACRRRIGEATDRQVKEWDAAAADDRPSYLVRSWWEDAMDEAAELLEEPGAARDPRPADLVREFHDKYAPVTEPAHDIHATRRQLLADEVQELLDADAAGDRAGTIKEAADVVYVLYGTAHTYGFDLDAAVAAVHASNMTKDQPLTPGGKAVKGPGYREADLSGIPGLERPIWADREAE